MRIFSGFTMFFYTLVFLAIGCGLIILSLNIIANEEVINFLDYSYSTFVNTRLIMGLVGLLLILYSLVAVQVSLGNIRREKTIAFDNPSGQVTISLSAIEDFIKRTAAHITEIKELRPSVTAGKKGINIVNRVTIYSDSNIPETTEKIQNILKSRIQDMLGIEEAINIKVHIAKIAAKEKEGKIPKVVNREGKKVSFKGIEYGNG